MSSVHNTAAAIASKFGFDYSKLNRACLVEYMARHSIPIGRESDSELLAIYNRLVVNKIKAGEPAYQCDPGCGAQIAGVPEAGVCPVCATPIGDDVEDEGDEDDESSDASVNEKPSERALDFSIQQIHQASVTTAVGFWRIGKELNHLFKSRLYRLRLDPETKRPKYKHWTQFVRAELPFDVRQATRAMTIAIAHTQESISAIGSIRKLEMIAAIPEGEQREKMRERVQAEGTTVTVLKGEVRKLLDELGPRDLTTQDRLPGRQAEGLRAGHGRTRRIPPGERAPIADTRTRTTTPGPEPVPESDRITAVVEPGVVELELKKRRPDGHLVATEDNLNGIVTEYAVYRKGDKTMIKITRTRP